MRSLSHSVVRSIKSVGWLTFAGSNDFSGMTAGGKGPGFVLKRSSGIGWLKSEITRDVSISEISPSGATISR